MSGTILHVLPDLETGGGQLVLLWTIDAMADVDDGSWRNLVLSVRGGPIEDTFRRAASQVVVGGGIAGAFRRGRKLITAEHVDVVHCNNTGTDRLVGQLIAMRGGPPVVNTLHGIAPARPRSDLRRRVNRLLARKIAWTIAVSSDAADSYVDALALPPERITIVAGCLPPDRFGRPLLADVERAKADLVVKPGELLIISVAWSRARTWNPFHW